MFGTLGRDSGVKAGVSFFLVLYKTDEDGNGQDICKRNCLQSQSNWGRMLFLRNAFSKSECPYRGHG